MVPELYGHSRRLEQLPAQLEHGRRELKSLIFSSHSSKKTQLNPVESERSEATIREVPIVLAEETQKCAEFKLQFLETWSAILESTLTMLREDPDVLNYLNRSIGDGACISAADVELSFLRSTWGTSKSTFRSLDSVGLTSDLSSLLFTDSQRTRATASQPQPTTDTYRSDQINVIAAPPPSKESQWLPLAEALTVLSSCVRGTLKGFLLTCMEVFKFRYSMYVDSVCAEWLFALCYFNRSRKFRRATQSIVGKTNISDQFTSSVLRLLENLDHLLRHEIWQSLLLFAEDVSKLLDPPSVSAAICEFIVLGAFIPQAFLD
eukprot:Gregarina_sp_Poly_1__6338@NODE_3376_length_1143_cov_47_183086_g586_i1_p1_GENE_NODE_3376_length_1143_cov_47_183086_g586_i1NODE_3376_length_1143_cov_47_183086_g586_i1_p1_ORF_typecomplete_len360_score49_08_NODE_3376_length_1143_cov_47_183086_g586_i11221081